MGADDLRNVPISVNVISHEIEKVHVLGQRRKVVSRSKATGADSDGQAYNNLLPSSISRIPDGLDQQWEVLDVGGLSSASCIPRILPIDVDAVESILWKARVVRNTSLQ